MAAYSSAFWIPLFGYRALTSISKRMVHHCRISRHRFGDQFSQRNLMGLGEGNQGGLGDNVTERVRVP